MIKQYWWKALCTVLLLYTIIAGFLVHPPITPRGNLLQSIRNIFFHVPMWFTMVTLFLVSVFYSVKYLRGFNLEDDLKAAEYAKVGVVFSVLGMATGMEWANYTWSSINGRTGPWTGDSKQICAALCMLIYFAYLILRGGIKDDEKRGRIAAVYNIFACALMFPLIFVIPRLNDASLHPGGAKGNPALNPQDSTAAIRAVLYPAFIGWVLLGLWITNIKIRMRRIGLQQEELELTTN